VNEASAELIARRLRVVGQPLRLQLLMSLRHRSATVSELTDALDAVQQNISQHLSILHEAGILKRRKRGTRVYYELADPNAIAMIEAAAASITTHSHALARFASDHAA
jgi:DNA-binding transcriptional ArsR family regulator